jgi:hypothetical protein
MGKAKDELDSDRERIALEMTSGLIGTGISVEGGGEKRGPYQVILSRLSRKKAEQVIEATKALLAPPTP